MKNNDKPKPKRKYKPPPSPMTHKLYNIPDEVSEAISNGNSYEYEIHHAVDKPEPLNGKELLKFAAYGVAFGLFCMGALYGFFELVLWIAS